MKILNKNLKQGSVKLLVEAPEDLWYLSQIIDIGDTIKAKTPRKIKISEEADAKKKMIFIALEIEKVEFSKNTNSLRANGKITDGPEDVPRGSYHTISIEEGTSLTLIKEHWYGYQLERLTEAAESTQAKVLICVFDREEAHFAMLKSSGVEILSHMKGDVKKKQMETKTGGNFYEQIIKQITDYDKRYKLDHIIIASPSFWKEELIKVLKDNELKKKLIQATCSSADERAINEVLKRPEIQTALKQERTSRELTLVEEVMQELSKKGTVAYGIKQVEDAANAGAIKTLIITDSLIQKLRQNEIFSQLDNVMRSVDKQKGKVVIISGDNEGGKKLNGIGGVAALLRYKLSYE